jgi:hypothetical protein
MLDPLLDPMATGKENNLLPSAKFLRQLILMGKKFLLLVNSKVQHSIHKT